MGGANTTEARGASGDLLEEPIGVVKFGLWMLAASPTAWLIVVHSLFFLTALRFGEWPHRPGFYKDAEHLANDPLYASNPHNPFVGYCLGTCDPKNYGPLYDLLLLAIPAIWIAAIAWLPTCLIALVLKCRATWPQHVLMGLGLSGVALTMIVDPLGVFDWFLD